MTDTTNKILLAKCLHEYLRDSEEISYKSQTDKRMQTIHLNEVRKVYHDIIKHFILNVHDYCWILDEITGKANTIKR